MEFTQNHATFITTKRFSIAQSFLLHFVIVALIRTQFTYFKGHNIGAKCVQMKTEALIVLKKVQSLQRGQDLQDVGNNAQDAFTSWALKMNSSW